MITANKRVMTAYEVAKELKQQLKTVELLLNPELDIIKQYMGESTTLFSTNGGEIVTYKQSKSRIIFNEKLFAIERPKIYAAYQEEKEGNRVLLLK